VKFHTDKVNPTYFPVYLSIAAEVGLAGRVCEVGVREGHSLDMWQALFPEGIVVGVDDLSEAGVTHKHPDGTHLVEAEQTDPQLPSLITVFSSRYDLIIDDASHDGAKTKLTWELLWPLVAPRGWYVVEDWLVGFPAWSTHDDSMLTLASWFVTQFNPATPHEIESIEYRHGMIIIQKDRRR
jgi:hypothetical protein